MEKYLSVCGERETEKIIEKSRFITRTAHVEDEEEARAYIAKIAKKHSDATHNCYAYIADDGASLLRFSDDGEPQGTAGMPMLEVLKARGLAYTAAVVTRYFGGIKLGAGGLVRAYSGCVAENLNAADIKSCELCAQNAYVTDYPNAGAAERYFASRGCNIISCEYSDRVTYIVAVKKAEEEGITQGLVNALRGNVQVVNQKNYFYPFPVK